MKMMLLKIIVTWFPYIKITNSQLSIKKSIYNGWRWSSKFQNLPPKTMAQVVKDMKRQTSTAATLFVIDSVLISIWGKMSNEIENHWTKLYTIFSFWLVYKKFSPRQILFYVVYSFHKFQKLEGFLSCILDVIWASTTSTLRNKLHILRRYSYTLFIILTCLHTSR